MPKFKIDLPDGRSVEVDAPDANTAAAGAVKWSSSNPIAGRAAADRDAARRLKSTPDQLRAISKGASFGFADELDAAGAALETGVGNVFKRATGQKPAYGMKDAYGAVMDANAKADNIFAKEHPVQNVGLQIAGGAIGPGMAGAARWVGGARSLAGATGRSALVGGITGAVAGAGNAEGDMANRGKGAVRGATTGAVIGGVLPAAGRVAQTGGRAIDNATGGRIGTLFGGHEARAVQRLADALRADGVDNAAINRLTQEWVQTGAPPPMLMNVAGENTRRLVRLAGMKEGEGARILGGIGGRERASLPATARNRARQLTPGEDRPANVVAEAATEARDTAAENAYRGPYREQTLVTPETSAALRGGPGRAAMQRARSAAEARQNYDQMDEIDRLMGGDFQEGTQPISAGTIDRVRIAMRGRAEKAGQSPDTRDIAGGLRDRARQIDTSLERIPEIQGARGNYRAHSQFIEGVEDVGPNIFKQSADEFAPQFEAVPAMGVDARRAGAQIGARQTMTDAFGQGPRRARSTIDSIADGEDPQRNLRALFGGEADRFVSAIRNMRQRVDNAQFVDPNVGSKTAPTQADAQAANDVLRVLQGSGLGVLIEKLRNGLTLTSEEAATIAQIATSLPDQAMSRLNAPQAPVPQIAGNLFRRAGVAATPMMASQGTGPR